MTDLRLSWLGAPLIELDGQPVHLETRKATALLVYLSVSQQSIPREVLANIFWPDYDPKHSQANLRRNLFSINHSLGGEILISEGRSVRINDRIPIRLDIDEFHAFIHTCKSHLHPILENCEECQVRLEQAAALYRGEFLTGLNLPDSPKFDEWQYFQRENLRNECAQALHWQVQSLEIRQEWEKAIQMARRWVFLDISNEPAQRELIHLYASSGQRSAALRQFDTLTHLLREELDQSPDEETIELHKQIQAGVTQVKSPEKTAALPLRPDQKIEPLLKTKLLIPPLRVERIPRPRLMELVTAGSQRALTLIAAPAGFGKTTLLSQWTICTKLPIAWYSLDESDNDPSHFVSYLIAALDSVIPGILEQDRGVFPSLQPAIQPILVELINQLTTVTEPFILVLDDYQFIHSQEIHKSLAFLLDKIPPSMHLVIATRTDPPLPLSRLRARDQLVEIRANDLRFTRDESAGFLKQVMSLDLTGEDVSALETRTEGWIAGLQMAALAIRAMVSFERGQGIEVNITQNKISEFIQVFSGSHRYILDYLGEEVLNRRPADIKRFLLQTSILERFSAPLCTAVTGMEGTQAILDLLEKENVFLIPLDHQRIWYRYHHLFAELLRYQLQENLSRSTGDPEERIPIDELNLRAAVWFEQHELTTEAIHHILAARQFDRAADLIEAQAHCMLFMKGQAYTLYQWLRAFPLDQLHLRPRLSISFAWVLFSQNQFEAIQVHLKSAQEAVQERQSPDAAAILGEIALAWGVLFEISERDVKRMRKQALLAWEKLPQDDLMLRGMAAWLLGASYYWDGDAIEGEKYFKKSVQLCREAGNIYFTLVSIGDLAGTLREQGRYHEAYQLLLQVEQEMSSGGRQPHPMVGHLYNASGQILLQWNDLEAAEQHLKQGIDLVSQDIPGEILLYGLSVLPYLKLAQGRREEALSLALDCLERIQSYPLAYVPNVIRAGLVRFWMRIGDRRRIDDWVSTCGCTCQDAIPYLRETEYITLAKVYLWQGRSDEALIVLAKLCECALSTGRKGKLFYLWALQGLALQQQNDLDRALTTLKDSLALAQFEGYVRAYVDEGEPMKDLLQRGSEQGLWKQASLDAYVNHLLDAFEEDEERLLFQSINTHGSDKT